MGINFLLLRKSLRTGWKRMALVAGSVAVGVLILLSFTAVFNAFTEQNHVAWLNGLHGGDTHKPIAGVDPVYYNIQPDSYNGNSYRVVELQASGPNSPDIFPGKKAPKPGEFYASPEVIRLMKERPEEHLADRYGGKLIGEIPESALPGSNYMLVVRGSNYPIKDGQLVINKLVSAPLDKVANYKFVTTTSSSYYDSANYDIMKVAVYVGVIILLFPVIMLVSIATRLGSVQREQRYVALRLIGVTNKQVTSIIATESAISTLIGIAIGWGLYLLVHPLLYNFSISDFLYWPSMVRVTWAQGLAIAGLTLAMSLLANWWGMRRVRTSPLGVSQRQMVEKKPGWWRILPLALGIAITAYLSGLKINYNDPDSAVKAMNQMMIDVVALMFGLIIATPWLTYHLSQLVARFARRPSVLLGMKYIRVHSRAISRSVSGVVLALFAGSFYILDTSGVVALENKSIQNEPWSKLRADTATISVLSDTSERKFLASLEHHETDTAMVKGYLKVDQDGPFISGECLKLNEYMTGLDCGNGKLVALNMETSTTDKHQIVYASSRDQLVVKMAEALSKTKGTDVQWATDYLRKPGDDSNRYLVKVDDKDFEALGSTLIKYDGGLKSDGVTLESAREANTPVLSPTIDDLANLAYAGMAATMAIAIVSIVVSTIGGLLERRRSLYTLRLGGMQAIELRYMVIIESLIPLVAMSVISAGLGAWSGITFTKLGSRSLQPVVTPMYVAVVIGSLVIATVVIYTILPMINRITSPDSNQTE